MNQKTLLTVLATVAVVIAVNQYTQGRTVLGGAPERGAWPF